MSDKGIIGGILTWLLPDAPKTALDWGYHIGCGKTVLDKVTSQKITAARIENAENGKYLDGEPYGFIGEVMAARKGFCV